MIFQLETYEAFFSDRLCGGDENLSKYAFLFDLREPANLKRREFSALKYKRAWDTLERQFGLVCQLQFVDGCEINDPSAIDHVIPLSSNVLNKTLRNAKPLLAGKKVPAESFGSNHISNLVLACTKCNGNKKHRFLGRDAMRRILKSKGF
jgi:5-methylcytosine-specific restriction endonuclease McrA